MPPNSFGGGLVGALITEIKIKVAEK